MQHTIRRLPWKIFGNPLTKADRATWCGMLKLWSCLVEDLCLQGFGVAELFRLCVEAAQFDIADCVDNLKDMQMLLREYESIRTSHLRVVRRKLHQRPPLPPFQYLEYCIFSLNFKESNVQSLNSLLAFPQRVTFNNLDGLDESMLQEASERFEKSGLYDLECVVEMSAIIADWCRNIDETQFRPSVSNGATTTVKRKDPLVDKLVEIGDFSGVQLLGDLHQSYDAEVQCVPKSATKKRVITKCDTNLVYYTLGVFKMLDSFFSTFLRRHVDLHNTTMSTELIRGENSLYYGTLDLSSASDLINWDLIKVLFGGTVLETYLVNFHVDKVLIEKTVQLSAMHAPMGAGTCFPVMTMLLCAACELACSRTGCPSSYVVYGDDIVIGGLAYYELRDTILPSLGLIVNQSKSYEPQHAFKEACGEETLNGKSIKPVRIPRQFNMSNILEGTTKGLECLLTLYDTMYEATHYTVCEYLEQMVHKYYGGVTSQTPILTPGGHLIYSFAPKARYNDQLQRYEIRLAVVSTERKYRKKRVETEKGRRTRVVKVPYVSDVTAKALAAKHVTAEKLRLNYTLYSIQDREKEPETPSDCWILSTCPRIKRNWVPLPEDLEAWVRI